MPSNQGKNFEGIVRDTLLDMRMSVDRLPDPPMGFKGWRNHCDFIAYNHPYCYHIECKSIKGNTFPLANLTENQWDGLLEKNKIYGCLGVVLVWFIEHDKIVAIDIEYLQKLEEQGKKSFNIKELDVLEGKSQHDQLNLDLMWREVACEVKRINPKITQGFFYQALDSLVVRKNVRNRY